MSLLSRLAVQAARAYGILSSKAGVSIDYLVVAGGGSGGGSWSAGGGGAGGMLTSTASLSTLNTYSVVVGAGGASTSGANGNQGNNSAISGTGLSTITATGGGYGAVIGGNGGNGGSGGGAGSNATTTGGTGIAGQGNNGGSNIYAASPYPSAGGGGAGSVGANSTSTTSGAGGSGSASSISGSSVTYAGGGGGGANQAYGGTAGAGGSGGGGAGGAAGSSGTAGTANLGGGGGGCGATSGTGGQGGSGIVIISYTSATPKFVGGTITTSGGKQIHTFTSSGTLSPITPITASYLVVAGGGGTSLDRSGGGGGGGLLTGSTTIYSGATYVVTVGAGGAGGSGTANATSAQDGSNSVLSGTGLTTITSTGGGGGNGAGGAGRNGGSGGGGGGNGSTSTSGGTGTSGQGTNGGNGASVAFGGAGGGGGGATSAGSNAPSGSVGGAGGAGTASSITGTSITYAGGGGGGASTTGGTGGAGGGGDGAGGSPSTQLRGVNGTQNLGGGAGGGSNYTSSAVTQASGGSGVVIISYAGSQQFNGGLVTTSGGNTIHTFTSTGALTPLTNNLNNSLRFRSSASAYLSRTPTITTNQKTWTWSAWIKIGALPNTNRYDLFDAGSNVSGNNSCAIYLGDNGNGGTNNLGVYDAISGSSTLINLQTTQVFRDPSAWYHIVVAVDTTQATSSNRVKIYVNGNQVTSFIASTYPSLNDSTAVNTNTAHTIGRFPTSSANYLDGYMTDINFIDGQALEPYYFGNNDANGVWKPIQYKGTYGTNGFYLTFGNTTSTTTLGYDSSPNGNNWTCNNISLTAGTTYDAMLDVPTNTSATVANYAVMNPLVRLYGTSTLSDANLKINDTSTGGGAGYASIAVTSGKFYYEFSPSAVGKTSGMGVTFASTYSFGYDGCYVNNGSVSNTTGGSAATYASYTTNDVIGVAFDADAGKVWFYKNNTIQAGDPVAGTSPAFTWAANSLVTATYAMDNSAGTVGINVNFGQRPFSYTPPTGYVALNTYNLPTPTILQGNKYMDATLYTGNGGTQVIVNQAQFKPDFVWYKQRNTTRDNGLEDSVRGAQQILISNSTNAEVSASGITSFNSNGFTQGSNVIGNESGGTYVGWQWQAGQGSTSSNTSGSITSTVSVNTTAGFSVVTYTGTGVAATIGHGLGVAPKFYIVKRRNASGDYWCCYHTSIGATKGIYLNTTDAAGTSDLWNNTEPTSTVFSVKTTSGVNASGGTYVAYCWAEIAGFSKFGSYTGNGSTDGPFVYTGFRPKFLMFKETNTSSFDWIIYDSSRNTFNAVNLRLNPNTSNAEFDVTTNYPFDFLSNGFKIRGTNGTANASGNTYIYAAFAENPFKNSNAR